MKKFSLIGVNGNAFCVMGYVIKAMKKAGFLRSDIIEYQRIAEAGDYSALIAKSAHIIEKCNEKLGLTESEEEDED